MNFNFKNLFNSFKFNFIREQMNLFSLKIAIKTILEWEATYWLMNKEVKICFVEVLTGSKLKTRSNTNHCFKLDLILNIMIFKQLKWENTLCPSTWAINTKIKIFRLTQLEWNKSFSIRNTSKILYNCLLMINK